MKQILSLSMVLVLSVLLMAGCGQNQTATGAADADDSQAVVVDTDDVPTAPDEDDTPDTPAANADEELHFVFVTPLFAHPVWLVARDGFYVAAEEFNFRADWVGPHVIDVDEMIRQIETAIVMGADGIITQGINPDAMVPVLNQAYEAGVPVVVVNSDIPGGPRLAYLGTDPTSLGGLGAQAIIDKLGDEPLNVGFIVAAIDNQIALEMVAGYEQVFETAPGGFTRLTMVADGGDVLEAVQHVENMITTFPELNVVVTVSGAAPGAVARVLVERDMVDQITVMGIDDVDETVIGIRDGVIYATMTQNFFRKGYQASQWLAEYIREGTTPPALINDSGTMIVTIDNIDTYDVDMMVPATW